MERVDFDFKIFTIYNECKNSFRKQHFPSSSPTAIPTVRPLTVSSTVKTRTRDIRRKLIVKLT